MTKGSLFVLADGRLVRAADQESFPGAVVEIANRGPTTFVPAQPGWILEDDDNRSRLVAWVVNECDHDDATGVVAVSEEPSASEPWVIRLNVCEHRGRLRYVGDED